MRKALCILLAFTLAFESALLAKVSATKASYVGGTVSEFMAHKGAVKGKLITEDAAALLFDYGKGRSFSIPYDKVLDLEYGQKAGRRVGASIATAVLLTPVGLFMLFSKKRKHYVTIGFTDEKGAEQVALFEVGKDQIRTLLPVLKVRTGKDINYQDEEAKKSGMGGK